MIKSLLTLCPDPTLASGHAATTPQTLLMQVISEMKHPKHLNDAGKLYLRQCVGQL